MLSIVQLSSMQASWCKETCYPQDQHIWSRTNPALGQCAVTVLLVQELLGGTLLYNQRYNHYWNRLTNGTEIDLTRSQFPEGTEITMDKIVKRHSLMNSEGSRQAQTRERYELLKKRFDSIVNS